MLRQTYALVNLDNLSFNIEQLRKYAKTDVLAVVKADAYGHGVKEIALRAKKEGVRYFAVATADEAVELRNIIDDHVLVLSHPVDDDSVEQMILNDISFSVFTEEHLKQIERIAPETGKKALIHLAIDSGMNRIGVKSIEELKNILDRIDRNLVELEGVFTHFATADEENKSFTYRQLEYFKSNVDEIKARGFSPIVHASNSAAILDIEEAHFDLCRMGISMYGYLPSDEMKNRITLKPLLSLVSHISHIKKIYAGDSVSYGRTFTAEKDMIIATVPVGYADGYSRALSNKATAFVNGRAVRQIGRVCMDQCMFDVSDIEAVNTGDEIVLLNEDFNADDMAEIENTISYEVLCNISKRVPRIYR